MSNVNSKIFASGNAELSVGVLLSFKINPYIKDDYIYI